MILADTSVWVQHLRVGIPAFEVALEEGEICCHEIVLGELGAGNLARRRQSLELLVTLPRVRAVSFNECWRFLENQKLFGIGIGWNDIQLLAAARVARETFWTFDKRLDEAARKMKVSRV
ncbi:MAG: type II toxin-antitoxin system VapC family toxin [Verrucomicrobia subdivision 3 bacterium]|nr:type II toxin-antitoxin system VapC family toxin [Limisphaerales bacterium]